MRKLKYHEKKLIKKVNIWEWKREYGHREAMIMRRYHINNRDDYKKLVLFFPSTCTLKAHFYLFFGLSVSVFSYFSRLFFVGPDIQDCVGWCRN